MCMAIILGSSPAVLPNPSSSALVCNQLGFDTTVTAGMGPHDAKWKTGWIENTMQTSLLLTKGTKFLFKTKATMFYMLFQFMINLDFSFVSKIACSLNPWKIW